MGAKGGAVGGSELQVRKASFATGESRSTTGGSGIQGATLRGPGDGRLSRRAAFQCSILQAQQTGI